MVGHRITNVHRTALVHYSLQLGRYLRDKAERPEFNTPTPEAFEKELLDRPLKSTKLKKEYFEQTLPEEVIEKLDSILGSDSVSLNLKPFTATGDVWVNQSFLGEVFRELLYNASRYVPKKGGEIQVGGTADTEDVRFTIQDNGTGITKENLPKIFDRHYTTRPQPTDTKETGGLGLNLIRDVVEQVFGGHITVESDGRRYDPKTKKVTESDVKQGTKFTITYPNRAPKVE